MPSTEANRKTGVLAGCAGIVKTMRDLLDGIPYLDFDTDNLGDWGVEVARVLKTLQIGIIYVFADNRPHMPLWEFDHIDMLLWSRNSYCSSCVSNDFGDDDSLSCIIIGAMMGRMVIRSRIAPGVQQMLAQNFPLHSSSSPKIPAGWHEQFTLLYKQHVEEATAKREMAKAERAKERKRKLAELERDYKIADRERKRLRTELVALAQEDDPDVKVEGVKMEDSEEDDRE